MSDAVALDLFIQDFIRSNRLLGANVPWETIVSRRNAEAPPSLRVFGFESGGHMHLAMGTYMALPDRDCMRIEFTREIPVTDEHRFDYLRMVSAKTHTQLSHSAKKGAICISLTTRHRGYIDVELIIRNERNPLNCDEAVFGGSMIGSSRGLPELI